MPQPSSARLHEFRIVSNDKIADGIFSLVIEAPALAAAIKPGQKSTFRFHASSGRRVFHELEKITDICAGVRKFNSQSALPGRR